MNKYNDRHRVWLSPAYMVLIAIIFALCARGFKHWHTEPHQQPEVHIQRGFMGLPSPPDCAHVYNVGKHKEWASCMGVGYK